MSLIPDEELKKQSNLNLAPMVDFLFLVIAVFAVLAVTRAALFDTELRLAKFQPPEKEKTLSRNADYYVINLAVNPYGQYKWITETREYVIEDPLTLQKEIKKQQELGLLPRDQNKTKILLHIDREAKWEPIVNLIFTIRQAGFDIYPVYECSER